MLKQPIHKTVLDLRSILSFIIVTNQKFYTFYNFKTLVHPHIFIFQFFFNLFISAVRVQQLRMYGLFQSNTAAFLCTLISVKAGQ